MVVLYVLLGIIAAVILLLSVKITVELRYEESASASVQVLFLRIPLFPREKKEKKPKKEKPKKEEEEKPKEEEKPQEEKPKGENMLQRFVRQQGFEGVILFLRDLMRVVGSLFGDIFKRSFVIQKFFVHIVVHRADAAQTALTYGKTCAAVYPALGYLCTHLRVRQFDADIEADYLANKSAAQMVFAVSVRPIKLIHAVMRFAFRALIVLLKTRKRATARKKAKEKEEKEQAVLQKQAVSIERNVDS